MGRMVASDIPELADYGVGKGRFGEAVARPPIWGSRRPGFQGRKPLAARY